MKSKATAQPPERENLHNVLVMEEASTEARLFHFPCVLSSRRRARAYPAMFLMTQEHR